MIKFRLYYDKDADEAFLNKMSSKGYAMKSFFLGFYFFEKSEPSEYTYRVDLINDKTNKELRDYIDLIEEAGGEYVQRWGIWGIFRKKGDFELYTDTESQIAAYSKIKKLFTSLGILEAVIFGMQVLTFYSDPDKTLPYISYLILIIAIAFFYQVYKLNNRIKKMKK